MPVLPPSTEPSPGRISRSQGQVAVPRVTRCVHIPCPRAPTAITLLPVRQPSVALARTRALEPPPPPSRAERLQALASGAFDVLIIGGGVTGAGAARDAALRGLN